MFVSALLPLHTVDVAQNRPNYAIAGHFPHHVPFTQIYYPIINKGKNKKDYRKLIANNMLLSSRSAFVWVKFALQNMPLPLEDWVFERS